MNRLRAIQDTKHVEYAALACALLALVIACIVLSNKSFFWMDEIVSYQLASDPSLTHMIYALANKADSTPPLYYVLAWAWVRLFGGSELSLRLFSCLGVSGALVSIWAVLRRMVDAWSTAFGTITVFCGTYLVIAQAANARFYGLFMLLCALSVLQFDNINRSDKPSWGLLVTNALVHGALVLTHLFGFLYSGAVLLSLLAGDALARRFRPRAYLSIVAGWLAFLIWLGPFIVQSDYAQPHSWIQVPYAVHLLILYVLGFSVHLPVVLLALLIILGVLCLTKRLPVFSRIVWLGAWNRPPERALIILSLVFVLVPVAAWIISRLIMPIFVPRYMLPTTLGFTVLFAHLSARILALSGENASDPPRWLSSRQKVTFIVSIATFLLLPVVTAIFSPYGSQSDAVGGVDEQFGYVDLPIASVSPHAYLPRLHYSPRRERYFYILDWDVAVDPGNIPDATVDYKQMEAFKRLYPDQYGANVLQADDFLARYDRFLYLDHPDRQWFAIRIRNNASYRYTVVGAVGGADVILIERKTPASNSSVAAAMLH